MQVVRNLAISATLVAAIAIVSKVAGFLREVALAFYFGAGVVTDAYLVATSIPGFFYFCVGAALTSALIPVYSKSCSNEGERARFIGAFLPIVALVCLILVVFLVLAAGPLVDLIAPGLNDEAKDLARQFTRIFAFGIFLTAAINVFTSILHVNGVFAVPALSGLAFSFSVLLSIFFAYQFGTNYLILGPLAGKAIEVMLMYPFVRRSFAKVVPRFDFSEPHTRAVLVLVGPMTLGLAAAQTNLIIDRVFGSQVESGAISALSYAFSLTNVVVSVVSVSVATVIYPALSRMTTDQIRGSAEAFASRALGLVLVAVIPLAFLLATLREEIVAQVFGRGKFDSLAVANTSVALGFYAFGIVGLTVREILTRVYYARGRPMFPALNVLSASLLNVLLTFWLAPRFGIAGIALATVVSVALSSLWLAWDALKSLGKSDLKLLFHSAVLVVGGASVATVVVVLADKSFELGLLIQVACFGSLYGVLLLLFKEPFSRSIFDSGLRISSRYFGSTRGG